MLVLKVAAVGSLLPFIIRLAVLMLTFQLAMLFELLTLLAELPCLLLR